MNPNLAIFFRRFAIFLVCIFLMAIAVYGLSFLSIDFTILGAWMLQGFYAIVIVGMMGLMIGIVLREVWTNILRRTESIILCCPDEKGDGIHIIGQHYFSGGDSGDGYNSYQHYYFRKADGKVYLSRKAKDKNSYHDSLTELSTKTGQKLKPSASAQHEIGYYKNDEKTIEKMINLPDGKLQIKSFENWFDYGFRISYFNHSGILQWKKTI
jgi:hypothetical protein